MAKSKATPWLTEDGLQKVEGWARSGLTDKEIARHIGISKQTFYVWVNKYPDFSDSISKGKADSLEFAEKMVFEHIRGFDYEEVETSIIQDNHGNEQKKVTKKKKKALPNDRMLQFYLRNRFSDIWNGKGTIELEKLQLENERLKAELEERQKSNVINDYEADKREFESKIDDVLEEYVDRLKGWFDDDKR